MTQATKALAQPKPDLERIGFSGLSRFGGLVNEEYVPELRGLRRIVTYERMRSDGLIECLLTAMRLPVMAAAWVVEPADSSPNGKRAADLVEANLFEGLSGSWEGEVRKALSHLWFGFACLAKQWAVIKRQVVLSEMMEIHPRTILQGGKRWEFAEGGQLAGVWQSGYDGQKWREELIPRERFVHLVNDPHCGDPEGRSILRASYKHWLIRDALYRYSSIGAQRGSVGLPVAEYPPGTPPSKQDELYDLVTGIETNEAAGAVVPAGVKLGNFQIKMATADLMALIRHHESMTTMSILAQFVTLGQEGGGGAYSLSVDQSQFFLMALEAIGDYVAAVYNHEVIPELVSYNIATDRYPKLSCTIARQSGSALADIIQKLTSGQMPVLTIDDALEDYVRERFQFPPRQAPRSAPAAQERGGGDKPALRAPGGTHSAGCTCEEHAFADPPQFKGEEPAHRRMGDVVRDFHGELVGAGEALRKKVFRIARLPDGDLGGLEKPRRRRRWLQGDGEDVFPALSPEQEQALDQAIEWFIEELFGEDPTLRGFVEDQTPDALLQGHLRLAHAVGVDEARRMTDEQSAAFAPTRDSPEIRSLLTDSFTRLSTNGEVRLRDYLGDIREALVQGALSGDSPLAVAQELSERFDAYNRNEFERLARTEMAFGFNRGILDELRAEGVWGVEILVGAMACPICLVHQGNTFALEDEEGEPLTRLGINVPPYHPNCLCSLVAAEGPASREAPDGGGGSDGSDESGRSDGGR